MAKAMYGLDPCRTLTLHWKSANRVTLLLHAQGSSEPLSVSVDESLNVNTSHMGVHVPAFRRTKPKRLNQTGIIPFIGRIRVCLKRRPGDTAVVQIDNFMAYLRVSALKNHKDLRWQMREPWHFLCGNRRVYADDYIADLPGVSANKALLELVAVAQDASSPPDIRPKGEQKLGTVMRLSVDFTMLRLRCEMIKFSETWEVLFPLPADWLHTANMTCEVCRDDVLQVEVQPWQAEEDTKDEPSEAKSTDMTAKRSVWPSTPLKCRKQLDAPLLKFAYDTSIAVDWSHTAVLDTQAELFCLLIDGELNYVGTGSVHSAENLQPDTEYRFQVSVVADTTSSSGTPANIGQISCSCLECKGEPVQMRQSPEVRFRTLATKKRNETGESDAKHMSLSMGAAVKDLISDDKASPLSALEKEVRHNSQLPLPLVHIIVEYSFALFVKFSQIESRLAALCGVEQLPDSYTTAAHRANGKVSCLVFLRAPACFIERRGAVKLAERKLQWAKLVRNNAQDPITPEELRLLGYGLLSEDEVQHFYATQRKLSARLEEEREAAERTKSEHFAKYRHCPHERYEYVFKSGQPPKRQIVCLSCRQVLASLWLRPCKCGYVVVGDDGAHVRRVGVDCDCPKEVYGMVTSIPWTLEHKRRILELTELKQVEILRAAAPESPRAAAASVANGSWSRAELFLLECSWENLMGYDNEPDSKASRRRFVSDSGREVESRDMRGLSSFFF